MSRLIGGTRPRGPVKSGMNTKLFASLSGQCQAFVSDPGI